jgi:hypothetical protein
MAEKQQTYKDRTEVSVGSHTFTIDAIANSPAAEITRLGDDAWVRW